MRHTPLADARNSNPFASSSRDTIPADLIGSSSRQLRKAVNVPLATAQTGENARKRREKERLGDSSSAISPYGRRKVDASRDRRREDSQNREFVTA
jgi:nucleoporin NUP1